MNFIRRFCFFKQKKYVLDHFGLKYKQEEFIKGAETTYE